MRAVDQCAGGRRYTLIGPATDATDATASTPRAGGQTAPQLPRLKRQWLMPGVGPAGAPRARLPPAPAGFRASGRRAGRAGLARPWCAACPSPPERAQLNKIVILSR